ncbi:MAG: ribosome-associated translation inhibitor RaiA [Gammaproteobacteria bacterium]|nr:ribosome-associated translation inhibitor RaiA [Gammaproteobacteria bacterium]
MHISLSGHHTHLSERLKVYIEKRFARLERHFDHISNIHVIVSQRKHGQQAEATLHASGTEIFANAEAEDPFAAIDALIDKLDRQVIKHKEKISNHRVQPAI